MWWRAHEEIFARMPFVERFVPEVRAPLPRDDERVDRVVGRVDAHRAVADEDHRPEVRLVHLVRAEELDARVRELGVGHAGLIMQSLHVSNRRVDVLAQAEDRRRAVRALVGADPFERAEAVVQRVRENVDLGVVPSERARHPSRSCRPYRPFGFASTQGLRGHPGPSRTVSLVKDRGSDHGNIDDSPSASPYRPAPDRATFP